MLRWACGESLDDLALGRFSDGAAVPEHLRLARRELEELDAGVWHDPYTFERGLRLLGIPVSVVPKAFWVMALETPATLRNDTVGYGPLRRTLHEVAAAAWRASRLGSTLLGHPGTVAAVDPIEGSPPVTALVLAVDAVRRALRRFDTPGERLREIATARGWSDADAALGTGLPLVLLHASLGGTRPDSGWLRAFARRGAFPIDVVLDDSDVPLRRDLDAVLCARGIRERLAATDAAWSALWSPGATLATVVGRVRNARMRSMVDLSRHHVSLFHAAGGTSMTGGTHRRAAHELRVSPLMFVGPDPANESLRRLLGGLVVLDSSESRLAPPTIRDRDVDAVRGMLPPDTGAAVAEMQRARFMSDAVLANAAGLSVVTVTNVTSGRHARSRSTLVKLMNAMDAPVDLVLAADVLAIHRLLRDQDAVRSRGDRAATAAGAMLVRAHWSDQTPLGTIVEAIREARALTLAEAGTGGRTSKQSAAWSLAATWARDAFLDLEGVDQAIPVFRMVAAGLGIEPEVILAGPLVALRSSLDVLSSGDAMERAVEVRRMAAVLSRAKHPGDVLRWLRSALLLDPAALAEGAAQRPDPRRPPITVAEIGMVEHGRQFPAALALRYLDALRVPPAALPPELAAAVAGGGSGMIRNSDPRGVSASRLE